MSEAATVKRFKVVQYPDGEPCFEADPHGAWVVWDGERSGNYGAKQMDADLSRLRGEVARLEQQLAESVAPEELRQWKAEASRLSGEVARLTAENEQLRSESVRALARHYGCGEHIAFGDAWRWLAERVELSRLAQELLQTHKSNAPTAEAALRERADRVQALQQALEEVLGYWYHQRVIDDTDDDQKTGRRPCPMTTTPTIADVRRWRAVLAGEAAPTQETQEG